MPLLPQKSNTEGNSETMSDRTPIPTGSYLMHIVKTEFKKTKAGTGHYLSTHFKVLDGEYTGRMVFLNLNLDSPNPVAVEIANKEANSISAACGWTDVEDSDEWLQVPLVVTVGIEPATSQYAAQNKITGYAPEADYEGGTMPTAPEAGVQAEIPADKPATAPPGVEKDVAKKAEGLPWE